MPAPLARLSAACAAALMILGGTAFVSTTVQPVSDVSDVSAASEAASLDPVDRYSCNQEWRMD